LFELFFTWLSDKDVNYKFDFLSLFGLIVENLFKLILFFEEMIESSTVIVFIELFLWNDEKSCYW
jgi:hypothetical protein